MNDRETTAMTLLEDWRAALRRGQDVAVLWLSRQPPGNVDELRRVIRDEVRAYSESERVRLCIPSDPGKTMAIELVLGGILAPVLRQIQEVERRAVSELNLIDAITGEGRFATRRRW